MIDSLFKDTRCIKMENGMGYNRRKKDSRAYRNLCALFDYAKEKD